MRGNWRVRRRAAAAAGMRPRLGMRGARAIAACGRGRSDNGSAAHPGDEAMPAREFLRTKVLELVARGRGLQPNGPCRPSGSGRRTALRASLAHFQAANQRLAKIDGAVERRASDLKRTWQTTPGTGSSPTSRWSSASSTARGGPSASSSSCSASAAPTFAPALAAYDAVAEDCYTAVRQAAPRMFRGPLLKPLCYMEHGYSPATMRRGCAARACSGEANPFPLVRIPWDRDQPWQAVFLHEVAHNLQADLGIWQENRQAVIRRAAASARRDPLITRIYGRWHKEIFADLAAILLGGPAAAWGMAMFLAHPGARTLTYRPGGAHPDRLICAS